MSLEDVGHFDHPKGFQYSKCLKLPDGRLLFTPFNEEAVLLFDPARKTWEKVGHFEGDCKWSGCAALPNGKVVFVPQYGLNILIFDPLAKTWEEVPIDPAWQKDPHFPKFSDCLTLPDGRVLFVPYYYTAIVIFDPATRSWEEIGRFEGNAKWSGCRLLPDGRLVFVPFSHPSILIFDLKTRSQEMVGKWEGGFKWSGSSELLPDGRLVFAPLKYKSILVFDPARRSWEEVGDFGGDTMKWNGCHLMGDGRVVFAPLDSPSVLFFDPSAKTWAEMPHGKTRDERMPQAHGHGCRMCTDCAALPDGRVVFVPCSCKEIVIYSPPALLRPSVAKGADALQGKFHYVTVREADDGKLYCAPFSAPEVLVIDPATGAAGKLGNLGPGPHKYTAMAKHSSGKLYSPPFSAERALVIDVAAGTATEIGGSLGTGHAKYECIVEADDGDLYCAPSDAERVLRIRPATGAVEQMGPVCGKLKGGRYTSILKADNGRLYSAPLNSTRVLMIDPAAGSVSEIGEDLGAGGGTCTPGVPGKGGPESDKWWAMAKGPDGVFYCPPCNGTHVLAIDPWTDSVYTVGPQFPGDSKWGGVAMAPNGKLYSPPRDAERVLCIDPLGAGAGGVYEVGRSLGRGGDKWSAIVLGRDGKLYCPPRGGKTCLVIDPATDTVEELPGQVSEGGKWQWMAAAAAGAGGTIFSPPCMQERVLSIAFSPAAPAAGPRPTRVLVTGAGGRTGSMVLKKMAGRRDLFDAVGTARSEASAAAVRASTGAECRVCDVQDPESVLGALGGVETVVILHSATPKPSKQAAGVKWTEQKAGAPPAFAYPAGAEPERIDWQGSKAVIDAAARAGVKHVVLFSSMGGTQPEHFLNQIPTAGGERGNIILWKRKAEMYLVKKGIPYTIIHPGGLLPFAAEPAPEGQRELMVAVDDDFGDLPPFARSIPRGDAAELVLQCVADPAAAAGRSFDVVASQPDPSGKRVWDRDLRALLAKLNGKNTDYAKLAHPILGSEPPAAAASPLARFLQGDAGVDPEVVAYVTKALQLETVSDFANFWTCGEYESGVQTDVVQRTAGFRDVSSAASRLQVARLRSAWQLAQAA